MEDMDDYLQCLDVIAETNHIVEQDPPDNILAAMKFIENNQLSIAGPPVYAAA